MNVSPVHARCLNRLRVLCFLASISLSVSPAFARISLEVLQRDGYGVVELKRPQPNVLTVPATINGHKVSLIVDTGALVEGIVVQNDHVRALRVSPQDRPEAVTSVTGKKIALKTARADTVSIGNVEIAGVPLLLGNLEGLRRTGSGFGYAGADGVLGAQFLRTCSGIIDLHNLRLYLRPPGKGHRVSLSPALRAAGLAEVPFSESCLVDVALNDTRGKMVLDTGAYHATASLDFAYKAGASVAGSFVRMRDVSGAAERTRLARFDSFKIGGVPVNAPDLRLANFPSYKQSGGQLVGFLGVDVLGQNGTIIDFGSQKLYFYPRAQ